jgi:ubiquinone biosynthesis UbiH/UbiF/VisC/COQ6 family hydroxylase
MKKTHAEDAGRVDVAVVGAGLVGLTAALGCAQMGLRTALIGPKPQALQPEPQVPQPKPQAPQPLPPPPFDVRIYALAPATVAVLQRLRVWDAVDTQRVQSVQRMRVFGDEGRELQFDAYGAAVERLATIAEEAELARALIAASGFAPNLVRHAGTLAELKLEPQEAQLRLDTGAAFTAALVIAADGARSAARAAAGIAATTAAYGQTALVANFACARAHDATAWQWFTDEGVVALLPLPASATAPHAVSLVWSAPDAMAAQLAALPAAALAERVTERVGGALGALAPIGATASFPLRRMSVARLVDARIALAGDAAHLVHPLAGQGLNLGLLDVAALLDTLAAREPFRDLGDRVLLRRYARARAEDLALMRTTTDGLARLFAIDDPLARRLRNEGLALVNRALPLKRALIRHALG